MWGTKKPKILIVEDEPANHPLFRRAYEDAGFEVVLSDTAEDDFVAAVAAIAPDVISMDLMIGKPGVVVKRDGFDAISLLRAHPTTKHIPIIVASNFSGDEKLIAAKELGVVDYYNLQGQPITHIARRLKEFVDDPRAYHPSHPLFRDAS